MNQNKESKELRDQLLESVNNGDLDKVEELLGKGVDVNAVGQISDFGFFPISPLSIASKKGYIEVVRALLQIPNIDVNQMDHYKTTALHRAAISGHLEVVEALLATKKADVNAELAMCGSTPLHLASGAVYAETGYAEIVEALLKTPGVIVNKRDQSGKTALHHSASQGHVEVTKILLNAPGILVSEKDYYHGHTPLHLASDFHHSEVVEALLSHPDTDVNVKDKCDQTPLHTSAYHGDLKIVEMLLQGGIDTRQKDEGGKTAVYWAEKQKKTRVVEMIVNHMKNIEVHGVDPNARRKQVDDLAQRIKRADILRMQNKNTARNRNDPNYQLLLAAKNDDLEMLQELLKQPGIDANVVDQHNNTPLHLASQRGSVELVKVLLKVKDIDVNATTIDKSKLFYPVHPGDDPNRGKLEIGKTPLHLAVHKGHVEVIKLLLNHPEIDVNAKDKYSEFPLWMAVENDDNKMVEVLLDHPRIDVNAKYICNDHFTSLHRAVEKGNLEVVNMLLSNPNVDVNVKDKYYRCTPLHFAVRRRNIKIVEAILNHQKVNLDVQDRFCHTPLHDAEERGSSEIVKMLREAREI